MQLPTQLKLAIENEANRIGIVELAKASTELSANYRFRQDTVKSFITTDAQRSAYLTTRMPATYAAIHSVLNEVKTVLPDLRADNLLDLGAGPGTAAWAAMQVFPELQQITLIERDKDIARLGEMLAAQSKIEALCTARWLTTDLLSTVSLPPHDVVICSYLLGELPPEKARQLLKIAWQAAGRVLVILEPGSKIGFALLRQLREDLIALGGRIVAPCPHEYACPMPANDWCHFAARVERSSLHRRLKGGALSYEDEKFSYLAFAKETVETANARIVHRPKINTGFIQLQLCTAQGLQDVTITRRDKDKFRSARKAQWGDSWGEGLEPRD